MPLSNSGHADQEKERIVLEVSSDPIGGWFPSSLAIEVGALLRAQIQGFYLPYIKVLAVETCISCYRTLPIPERFLQGF